MVSQSAREQEQQDQMETLGSFLYPGEQMRYLEVKNPTQFQYFES